ncbi:MULTISPECIES: hypothetical protein [unclassified Acidovorax]|uniref:hypothetical protein n=1 Tax=unclassified Acidovorax TaxID=2684926 RepID=UPI0028834541|nr:MULTISPECIES: hypothetical protein [unclassified Acidovorax]
MMIAPMVGVIEPCILIQPPNSDVPASLAKRCGGSDGSAGALIDATLQDFSPTPTSPVRYPLGYTLPVPLLQLFKKEGQRWEIDQDMVKRLVHTIRDSNHPLVLYLFSTHFAANAPIERELAEDTANLAQTRDGPLGVDSYYDSSIYNWSFARTDNPITQRRLQAIHAVLDEACGLEEKDREKIRAITLLGELHHLFPDFQAGMGYGTPYRITDYSAESVRNFRKSLEREFQSIAQFNRLIGSNYRSFNEIDPPSKDIRTEPLTRFSEHIDSFAHGSLPVSGWAFLPNAQPGRPLHIQIYRNGVYAGKAAVQLSRQDVLAAMPQFGSANTGWRLELDFRQWPTGLHQLDIFLEDEPGRLSHLGTRQVAVMDRQQNTPQLQPQRALPRSLPASPALQASIDFPQEQSSYYYNPLVNLWHAFRSRQISRYLAYIDKPVQASCLASVPRYTHQIIPFTNPSWDTHKFAIEDSLRKNSGSGLRLGVSLYGESTYGPTFSDWLKRSGHHRYGVTEFHPLKAMDRQAMADVLKSHSEQGADFLSFFVEPTWEGQRVPRGHNIFSLDPLNPQFASDKLFHAMQGTLRDER